MQLRYSLTGHSGGPLVLLLHGFLGSHADWDTVTKSLAARFRCVAVDLPGHGGSVGLNDDEYTMPAAATALIDLVDTLDAASFSVVGYSMGGRLALYLSSIYAMRIDALVIESASPGLRTETDRAERRAQDETWAQMLEVEGMRPFLETWYRQPLFASTAARPELLEKLATSRSSNDPRELVRALRGMCVANQRPLWDEWRANHIPALVVAGALDAKYCAIAHDMAESCSFAKTVIVPGAGHNVHEEAPDDYNRAVVEFLSTVLR